MSSEECNDGVMPVSIEWEMQTAYLAYAMSVIISRAIPDVRDGLKPVQRRILYAMYENGFAWNKPYKKSARVVGEVIGKYHPHGDNAVYDALVHLAQDFSMGAVLLHGQGNFGSIDADPPAAMRYTEVRLSKISHTMLEDLDSDTVDFRDNYDGLEQEPVVLPAAYPNILANGSEGIAVGMATKIPPYNLGEIIDACQYCLRDPLADDSEIVKCLQGPDFPTGATIINSSVIQKAMLSGRGSITMRGKASIEKISNGKEAVIITEIPYQVVKSQLVMKIAELMRDKRIEASRVRDESSRQGIRIFIEAKRDVSGAILLNQLYKFTPLQSTFAVNMLVLNDNKPEVMGVVSIIRRFLKFREDVIVRRLNYVLRKVRDRAHIMLGLHVAVDSIDQVINLIRNSADNAEAKKKLLSISWPASESVTTLIELVSETGNVVVDGKFTFTEEQAKAILEIRLSRLTGLERDKIIAELKQLGSEIAHNLAILADRNKILAIISEELNKIKEDFAIARRTTVEEVDGDTDAEDLIEPDDVMISITNNGYIKRTSLKAYTAQRRGGRGKNAMPTHSDDDIIEMLISNTHHYILFFSNKGRVYKIKTYRLPIGSNQSKGRAMINLLPHLDKDERIKNFLSLPDKYGTVAVEYCLVFATKKGNVRRSSVADFANINVNGKIAIGLEDDDDLIGVCLVQSPDDNVLLATKKGMAIRFTVDDLRVVKSRNSDGVRGITLDEGDEVISISVLLDHENDSEIKEEYLRIPLDVRMSITVMDDATLESKMEALRKSGVAIRRFDLEHLRKLAHGEQFLLTVTESGHGKRTSSYAYRITNRGGKGIINMDISRGRVVATFVASDADDILLIADSGRIIRCKANDVPVISRNTKGVKIVDLSPDEKVVSMGKVSNISCEEDILTSAVAEETPNAQTVSLFDQN